MVTPSVNEEDNRLVKRCLAGDQAAWNDLVQKHLGRTRQQVISILKRRNCAFLIDQHLEEIVITIFEKLFKSLHGYNFTDFQRWFSFLCYSQTHQFLREELRYRNQEKAVLDSPVRTNSGEGKTISHGEMTSSSNRSPQEQLLDRELRRSVDRLPEKYALPIKLFYFEEMDYQEIARTLNIALNTVGTRLSRGLELLRKNQPG